jgi:ubiquinone/menaquinone biosynthesis C-methylase UbiE
MDYEKIYAEHAEQYDALVAAEDCDHQLLPALEQIVQLKGADILEVGVGTARVTRLIAPIAHRVVGVERSPAMLAVARRHLSAADNCTLCLGDAHALPVDAGWADVAIAGWVFGHFRYWLEANWRESIAGALEQMERALKPGGTLILIETLGTGSEEPAPPSAELAEYYDWLEREKKFVRRSIRTDYAFTSVERAAEMTGFFFGEDFAKRVREEHWSRIPECTGVWFCSRESS